MHVSGKKDSFTSENRNGILWNSNSLHSCQTGHHMVQKGKHISSEALRQGEVTQDQKAPVSLHLPIQGPRKD